MENVCLIEEYINTDISVLKKTIDSILFRLNQNGITKEYCIFDIKVILNELLNNCFFHGNKKDYNKKVYIKVYIYNKKSIVIIISDEGCGFNKEKICEDKNLLAQCGRGLQIVKNLSDSMKINNKGNKIVVLKNIV